MKAIMLHGPNDLRVDELPEPTPGPNDVVIRLAACGICGTDLSFAAVGGMLGPSDTPMALGHELSGIIAATGAGVTHLLPGQRVVVNPTSESNMIGSGGAGGFADYLLVRDAAPGEHVFPIPDSLSFEEAALTEPLSVALHGVNRAGVGPGSRVAVFGAGPIGLGVVLFLRQRGVEDIVVFDMSDQRLERALALGAKTVLNPARVDVRQSLGEAHGTGTLYGWPVVHTDTFIEVSGAARVIPDTIAMAPLHARLVVIAVHHAPVPVDFQTALAKEMTFTTSLAYPTEFNDVLELLIARKIDVEPMISHRYTFDQFMEAFATAQDKERSAKVMITFPH
ncbi:MAG: alcohol dehydrogenase catalytic domain-containing protein [Haliea sp.]